MPQANTYPMKNILILSFCFCCLTANAQQMNIMQDTLTWSVVSAVNQADQTPFAYTCSFITYGANSLDWSQVNGEIVSNYTITSSTGQWADLTSDGTTAFNVQNATGNITGTLSFARSSGVITVHLQLLVKGKLDQDYVFAVSSITPGQ
jgi:hypothetical protein